MLFRMIWSDEYIIPGKAIKTNDADIIVIIKTPFYEESSSRSSNKMENHVDNSRIDEILVLNLYINSGGEVNFW